MPLALSISSAAVPSSLECVITNAKWQELIALLSANLNTQIGIVNVGSETPEPANNGFPWIRSNPADDSPDRTYNYWHGAWHSRHALPPGAVTLYRGAATSIDAYDGGEPGAVTATSGPFWAVVPTMVGRMPLHPGTVAGGITIVGVGDTGGEEKHVLIQAELPQIYPALTEVDGIATGATATFRLDTTGTPDNRKRLTLQDGSGLGHNNLPPYLGIWFLERTARLFYRV